MKPSSVRGLGARSVLSHLWLILALIGALGFTGFFQIQAKSDSPSGVEVLAGTNYAKRVEELILSAKSKVWVALYVASYQADRGNALENKLFNALAKVHSKGVDVRVVLDRGLEWDSAKAQLSKERSDKNDAAFEFLKSKGISVRWDSFEQIMHAKFVVVDESYAVLGSHNWTYSALSKNVELSVLLSRESDCQPVAKVFKELWEKCHDE